MDAAAFFAKLKGMSWTNGSGPIYDFVNANKPHLTSHADDGSTILQFLLQSGGPDKAVDEAVVDILDLMDDEQIEIPGYNGETVIHTAVRSQHPKVYQKLFTRKADATAQRDDGRTALHSACYLDDVDGVRQLLEYSDNIIQIKDEDGCTPLDITCWRGSVDVIKLILEKDKTTLTMTDNEGNTPLSTAVRYSHKDIAEELLRHGNETIDTANKIGVTPLDRSCSAGMVDIAELLLDNGANIECADSLGFTPFITACAYGQVAVAKLLASRNANIKAQTLEGVTALMRTCRFGYFETAQFILSTPAGLESVHQEDHESTTALVIACRYGHFDIVSALLDVGADATKADDDGYAPILEASKWRYTNIVDLLLKTASNPQELLKHTGGQKSNFTALQYACYYGHLEIVEVLLRYGANVDEPDVDGLTPLHNASRRGYKELVELISERSTNIHAADNEGWTALHFASSHKLLDEDELKYKDLGRESYMDADGGTPIAGNHTEVIRYLIKKGLDPWATTKEGQTPIHLAAMNGNHSRIGILLEVERKPAHLQMRDSSQWTALGRAMEQQNSYVVRQLLPVMKNADLGDVEDKEELMLWLATHEETHDLVCLVLSKAPDKPDSPPHASKDWGALEWAAYMGYPKLVWWILFGSRPSSDRDEKIRAAETIASQFVVGRRHKGPAASTKAGDVNAKEDRHKERNETDDKNEDSYWQYQATQDSHLQVLNVLRNPPMTQTAGQRQRLNKLSDKPVYLQDTSELLDSSRAEVVDFYSFKGYSGFLRRGASVKDVIYNRGPAQIMSSARERTHTLDSQFGPSGGIASLDWGEDDVNVRWIHLPANNIQWMSDLATTVSAESGIDPSGLTWLGQSWEQVLTKNKALRFMKPKCIYRMEAESEDNGGGSDASGSEAGAQASQFAIYMPYLTISEYRKSDRKSSFKVKQRFDKHVSHKSLTLDEFYYHACEEQNLQHDILHRNEDQVLSKNVHKSTTDWDSLALIKVDQLWIWVFDDKTIISSSTYETDNGDDSLFASVLDVVGGTNGRRRGPSDTFQMSRIIVDACVSFFDREFKIKIDSESHGISAEWAGSIHDAFTNAIAQAALGEAELYNQFATDERTNRKSIATGPEANNKRREILEAASLFREIKDIRDELKMLKTIAEHQALIQKDAPEMNSSYATASSESVVGTLTQMDRDAARIENAVNTTLTLEQNEISIAQAQEAVSQGRTLMIFTVVTILFLPLSFFTSFFALDVAAFQQTPPWTFLVIFLSSLGIFTILATYAFYSDTIAGLYSRKLALKGHSPSGIPRPQRTSTFSSTRGRAYGDETPWPRPTEASPAPHRREARLHRNIFIRVGCHLRLFHTPRHLRDNSNMRLLQRTDNGEISLSDKFEDGDEIPPYAVLSHTWGADTDEVTFDDLMSGVSNAKPGFEKIRFCDKQTRQDDLGYFWIDTCCINKANKGELSIAIQSMFRWYSKAARCYVYLSDVSAPVHGANNEAHPPSWQADFRNSKWFTRGWTLQELLAPSCVEFFSREGRKLGDKISLQQWIYEITGIPKAALEGALLSEFTINERLRWKQYRQTKIEEDLIYSMLGIFDIHLSPMYGEGIANAFKRLENEIEKHNSCIRDICVTDPRHDKKRIVNMKDGLLEGSYRWVLSNAAFEQWYTNLQSKLLWIKGDPGKGKTMLLCGIIEELQKDRPRGSLLSYFFCQATDSRINNAAAVLRGLLYLLVCQQPSLVSHIRKRHDHAGRSLFEDVNAWMALTEIFTDMLQDPHLSPAYLIVDALDECTDGLQKLLEFIADQSSATPRVKWLISSRNLEEIEGGLHGAENSTKLSLELNAGSVSKAVRTFIDLKVTQLAEQEKYDEQLKVAVLDYLVDNADNTFLWVALMCQDLKRTKRRHVKRKLAPLPPGLDSLYQRMLQYMRNSDDAELCRLVLAVVTILYRPITLHELTALVAQLGDLADDLPSLKETIAQCGSFLILREETVYFVHQSAKDFLLAEDVSAEIFPHGIENIHYSIFERSLQTLTNTLKRDIYGLEKLGYCIDDIQLPIPDPLVAARYSCVYWMDHFCASNGTENHSLEDGGIIDKFLRDKYIYWLEAASLCKGLSKAVLSIQELWSLTQSCKTNGVASGLHELVHDARRFVMYHKVAIESYPLQTYASALLLSPRRSLIRQLFRDEKTKAIELTTPLNDDWSPCLQTLEGHTDTVLSVAFSPDSALLASGSEDRTVKLWSATNGECLRTFEGHDSVVLTVAFSHDSKHIASGSSDFTIKIWDLVHGVYLRTLRGHTDEVTSVVYSHDSTWLASASGDETLKIWSTSNGQCVRTMSGHSEGVCCIAVSHDSTRLASASYDGTLKLWDAWSGECMRTWSHDSVESVAFSNDPALLVSGSGENGTKVWNVVSGACLQTLDKASGPLAFSRDSKLVASAFNNVAHVWNVEKGASDNLFYGHSDEIWAIAFSYDSIRLASASFDNTIKVWDTSDGGALQDLDISYERDELLAISSEAIWLLSTHRDSLVVPIDKSLEYHGKNTCSVDIWDVARGRCVESFDLGTGMALALTRDETRMALLCDSKIKILEVRSGNCLQTLASGECIEHCKGTFSDDSTLLACAFQNDQREITIKIWDVSTGWDPMLRNKAYQTQATSKSLFTMTAIQIPQLRAAGASKQLLVHGKPFLMLAGELQNSSLTSADYMNTVWQNLVDTNINTVLGCVTWEMIEPVEDKFWFGPLDRVIEGARSYGLHLVLLWFGSFKNGLSTYVPEWVKTNPERFPRAKLRKAGGILQTADILSLFHDEGRNADAKAFEKLMAHLKEFDEAHSTVIMVQVENEPGLLGDSRDGSNAANKRFLEPVPPELIDFLDNDWDALHDDLLPNLQQFHNRSPDLSKDASWETVFGSGPKTDELFMAYHYAKYINHVASKGKTAYSIPHYTNVWMNYAGEDSDNRFPIVVGGGGEPGDYPSGGPTSNVLDIWQKFAPALDFIGPDVYLTDYERGCAKYRHRGQPLFIPEQRRDAYGVRRIWVAYGSYAAMGVSPFGIDTLEPATNPFTKHYALLKSVSAIILEAQRTPGSSVGFFFDELSDDGTDTSKAIVHEWAGFRLTIERCFVFGKPGPGCGMIIHRGDGVFLLIGWGFQVKARSVNPRASFTGILRFCEKTVANVEKGELKTERVLNGDETRSGSAALMPNEDPDYGGFPISVTIPSRTMIAEVKFYDIVD
ncbi:Vegetative incompatibility protein [Paramyrothecium foliicola]|nr:Vegetative incompatibility protein [Paramyrothecium foliicola]